jgi:hypothetical protein
MEDYYCNNNLSLSYIPRLLCAAPWSLIHVLKIYEEMFLCLELGYQTTLVVKMVSVTEPSSAIGRV